MSGKPLLVVALELCSKCNSVYSLVSSYAQKQKKKGACMCVLVYLYIFFIGSTFKSIVFFY